MDPLLRWARAKRAEIVAFIRELVECESPSDSPEAIQRFFDLFAHAIGDVADCRPESGVLLCRFRSSAGNASKRLLALGHADTVWPLGALAKMPFREERGRVSFPEDGGRLYGPGVLDMKAGLAFFVFAMRALNDLGIAIHHEVLLQINPDEETGSRASRAITEANAKRSVAVLVLEPGAGLEGKVKTARKGIGDYRVRVRGVASHAGVDFERGASAILEMARQIERIAAFTDMDRGVTVNPGVISGGTRSNVIAAEAEAHIDIRVPTLPDAEELERRFRALAPINPRCSLEVSGGLNRPPMERTPAITALFEQARGYARELGVELEESSTGGGSDANFTAALGVPTLDGLGAVGEGAHATHESILADRIADRVALLAKLVAGS
jgi:glutamate carboxypeptidase